jgi:phytoene synthase
MQMDITVTYYATYADLQDYMYGSAEVIGLQMLPILEPVTDEAREPARLLGEAFQLTNFIRDVGEDLLRGRVYLPAEDLAAAGVTRDDLARGTVTPGVRELLRFEIARARGLYRQAEPGLDMLHPTSRDCVRTAFELYGRILDAVEAADYQVLDQRVSVGVPERLRVAVPRLIAARSARRRAGAGQPGVPTTPTRASIG